MLSKSGIIYGGNRQTMFLVETHLQTESSVEEKARREVEVGADVLHCPSQSKENPPVPYIVIAPAFTFITIISTSSHIFPSLLC